MAHSIPDMFAYALTCELGTTLVTGDYKFDQTPVDGIPADVARLAELGRDGHAAALRRLHQRRPAGLVAVGVDRRPAPARRPSRAARAGSWSPASRRTSTACSRWSTPRPRSGRKVSLVGRSMRKNVNIGRQLGHIDVPDGMLVEPKQIEDFPDDKLVVISTGSQGEPLSALRRMAARRPPARGPARAATPWSSPPPRSRATSAR